MPQTDSRTARRAALLAAAVALAVIAATASTGLVSESILAPHDGGEGGDSLPGTDAYDDPIVDYDAVDYELALNSTAENDLNYSLTILGAVEPVDDAANGTVDCADQLCRVEGTLEPDETATYHVSGSIVGVQPKEDLVSHVNGTFEGDALVGIGTGALSPNASAADHSERDDGSTSDESATDRASEPVDRASDEPPDETVDGGDEAEGDETDGGSDETATDGGVDVHVDASADASAAASADADSSAAPDGETDADEEPQNDGDDNESDENSGENESDGGAEVTADDISIDYENCHTVSIDVDGDANADDWEIWELSTRFFVEDGVDTMILEPDDDLPTTIDANERVDGAVTDVEIEHVMLTGDGGQTFVEASQPDESCGEQINQQWEEYQDDADGESDETGDGDDADPEAATDDENTADEADTDEDGESADDDPADEGGGSDEQTGEAESSDGRDGGGADDAGDETEGTDSAERTDENGEDEVARSGTEDTNGTASG